jgi:hypothetical protein
MLVSVSADRRQGLVDAAHARRGLADMPDLIDWRSQRASPFASLPAGSTSAWLRQAPREMLDDALDVNRDLRIEMPVA